jgi:hypothetical protein
MNSLISRSFLILTVGFLTVFSCGCSDEEPIPVDDRIQPASPAMLLDWMKNALIYSRNSRMNEPEVARIMAYAGIAYYEGFSSGIPQSKSLQGQLTDLENLPAPNSTSSYNWGVVASTSLYKMLMYLFKNESSSILTAIISQHNSNLDEYYFNGVSDSRMQLSIEYGEDLGSALVDWAKQDGIAEYGNCADTLDYPLNQWQRTHPCELAPVEPCWGLLRPFTFGVAQTDLTCLPGAGIPYSTDTASFYFKEAKEMIQAQVDLTDQQLEDAVFWNDGIFSYKAAGHSIHQLVDIIEQHDLDGSQASIEFARLGIACADVYISAWKMKYDHKPMRPITFIRNNIFINFEGPVESPAHPEFPCSNALVGYATAQIFTNSFSNLSFTDNALRILGKDPRTYSDFMDMANENAMAQFYGGSNYLNTVEASEYQGRCIGQRANELVFIE